MSDHSCKNAPTFTVEDGGLNRILQKISHSDICREFTVYCPGIATSCAAGQFVIVLKDDKAERIPLTIADFDPSAGTITIVMQIVGLATHRIDDLQEGECFHGVMGPLGHPSEIEKYGTVVLVAGGLGIAPVYPIQRALKQSGNTIISIVGARSASLLFWEDKLKATSDKYIVCTDDGSTGEKALVTKPLQDLLQSGEKIDRVVCIGPPVMMRAVAEVTRAYGIKTMASLNTLMLDGTGMCGACRVEVAGKVKFTCVDGPEFDAHQVNFAQLASRLSGWKNQEKSSYTSHLESERTGKGEQHYPHEETPVSIETIDDSDVCEGRIPMPCRAPSERKHHWKEVALGYSLERAQREASRCLQCKNPRCIEGCPVGIAIPQFIRLIKDGKITEAYAKIRESNRLPAICGRVCPQETQCEAHCVLKRSGLKKSVAIGALERFAADNGQYTAVPIEKDTSNKKVAVIGSGPAGLTAASELVSYGLAVTVFEALHMAGGVLAYGIPEFRLPKSIVEEEVHQLRTMGVQFQLNVPIGKQESVPSLLSNGFDAVFIGTGAGLPKFLGIPGEHLKGVFSANEFLSRVNLMKAYHFPEYDTPAPIGKFVVVVGGGNVAMDAARSALRLGAERVTIVYRRTRAEMPARAEEIHHADEEGIQWIELAAPVSISGTEDSAVKGLICRKCVLGEPDASGRRSPVEVEGSEFEIPCDEIISAIGSGANPILTQNYPDLIVDKRGYIPVDENGMTNVPGVFAGGDIVTGSATVILAMGAAKKAASAIRGYLMS